VFGDNQNDIHNCPECSTSREIRRGAGITTGMW
jgi:ribosomal protein L37AE/L43A